MKKKLRSWLWGILIAILVVVSALWGVNEYSNRMVAKLLDRYAAGSPAITETPSAPSEEDSPTPDTPEEQESSPVGTTKPKKTNPSVDYWKALQMQSIASVSDKAKVYSIVLSCLSTEELKRFVGYLKDGVTSAEMNEVVSVMSQRITGSDYQELYRLYLKYLDQL